MRARQQAFVQLEGKDFAKVQEVDRLARTLSITKSGKRRDEHPTALFAFEYVNVEKIEAAIYRLAEDVAEAGSLAMPRSRPPSSSCSVDRHTSAHRRGMRLANGLRRFREMATSVSISTAPR